MNKDRNFNGIADHFVRKIYGGLKGQIRLDVLWRDLSEQVLPHLPSQANVIDAGAGLAQLAIKLAQRGHNVTINDISTEMLTLAKESAKSAELSNNTQWLQSPLQQLTQQLPGKTFDLVICHAVLEWLAQPAEAIPYLRSLMTEEGWLSLTFYNRDGLVYHNLMRGNFNKAISKDFAGDPNSLTPSNPLSLAEVTGWLQKQGLMVVYKSGIRVFHDYVRQPSGGNLLPEEVRRMELRHSNCEPFAGLGRYIHLLCRPQR
ncbi:methyltransferase domain-containing protein [Porticoccus sp. W117]|uniref:methyltransferase domain-containing protein n=1 Tax=Porticoccus sp. W117 TaxID=3054777 RepID=UPI002593CD09|nr:methyltransferase domain-containing protein [Porticoccus sp. W117]MDM3871920.1 methyltransferase domain-containing protein [Porticoccus sp. W117]